MLLPTTRLTMVDDDVGLSFASIRAWGGHLLGYDKIREVRERIHRLAPVDDSCPIAAVPLVEPALKGVMVDLVSQTHHAAGIFNEHE